MTLASTGTRHDGGGFGAVSRLTLLTAFAVMTGQGVARAEDVGASSAQMTARADQIAELKAQSAALEKRNTDLVKRLEKLERQRGAPDPASLQAHAPGADSVAALPNGVKDVIAGDGPLTWHGLTLYGSVQAGLAYLTHGAPFSGFAASSYPYLISKYSNRPVFGFAGNNYGNTYLGLKGETEIIPGWSAFFNLQSYFDSGSGQLSDGLKSLQLQNGVPLKNQSANSDTSLAGQPFNAAAFVGVSSTTFGKLTFGRQNALTADNMIKYDPMRTGNGFSVFGYAGSYSAIGATEDRRWDMATKYQVSAGPARFAAMVKQGDYAGANPAYQIGGGASYEGFSFDAYFGHYADAILSSSLTSVQLKTLPADSLAGTVADTQGAQIGASYTWKDFVIFGGYEQIHFSNPSNRLSPGISTIGGYVLSAINNAAYPHQRIVQAGWTGLRYSYSKDLEFDAAYYSVTQNSYGVAYCRNTSAITCAGWLQAYSLLADYRLSKRFDVYGGLFYSVYGGGMASGSLYKNNFMPQAGMRYTF
ncbi:putative porin [Rhodoblastus acidophilus]|uniref:porin n=1 Tax=Rhodoblastus acidophilus TaxID=1074 RepID=UPI0022249874|nr:porin [Rhodoblastus acidophilus]MCW2285818.1 putative porin [Rhodoblastus acidophilus]MCW2333359.1 putative porin [Rhodoblastus acidophilus]